MINKTPISRELSVNRQTFNKLNVIPGNWQQVYEAAAASDRRVIEGAGDDAAGAVADCGLSAGAGCEPSVGQGRRRRGRNSVGSARSLSADRQVKFVGKNIVYCRVIVFCPRVAGPNPNSEKR